MLVVNVCLSKPWKPTPKPPRTTKSPLPIHGISEPEPGSRGQIVVLERFLRIARRSPLSCHRIDQRIHVEAGRQVGLGPGLTDRSVRNGRCGGPRFRTSFRLTRQSSCMKNPKSCSAKAIRADAGIKLTAARRVVLHDPPGVWKLTSPDRWSAFLPIRTLSSPPNFQECLPRRTARTVARTTSPETGRDVASLPPRPVIPRIRDSRNAQSARRLFHAVLSGIRRRSH